MRSLKPGHAKHQHASRDVGDEEHHPPVVAIGNDPGRYRQEHVGQDPGCPDDPKQDRVRAVAVHHDEQRDEVEPVPDRGHELARQQLRQRRIGE